MEHIIENVTEEEMLLLEKEGDNGVVSLVLSVMGRL